MKSKKTLQELNLLDRFLFAEAEELIAMLKYFETTTVEGAGAAVAVKVRAYKVLNGKKIYGPWSSVKALRR